MYKIESTDNKYMKIKRALIFTVFSKAIIYIFISLISFIIFSVLVLYYFTQMCFTVAIK